MSLSLQRIGELKALAEREAKPTLIRLLDLRKDERAAIAFVANSKALALLKFAEERGIWDRPSLEELAAFYGPELDRQMEALVDLGVAVLGIGKAEQP